MSTSLRALSADQVAREVGAWLVRKRDQYQRLVHLRPMDMTVIVAEEFGGLSEREAAIAKSAALAATAEDKAFATQDGGVLAMTGGGRTIGALTRYAQTGELGNFADPLAVLNAAKSFREAIEDDEDGRHLSLPADAWTALDGAVGRARLALGKSVAPKHVVILGPVSARRVRQLGADGGPLPRKSWGTQDARIEAKHAVAWLAEHGMVIEAWPKVLP